MSLIVKDLASALFYHEQGVEKNFEKTTTEEAKPYVEKAIVFLQHLDKMGFLLIPEKEYHERLKSDDKNVEILTRIISDFVKKLNTTRPELFPNKELAFKILNC